MQASSAATGTETVLDLRSVGKRFGKRNGIVFESKIEIGDGAV